MNQILSVVAATEGGEPQGIAALGIDPTVIVLQGITFILFFLIVKKFAFTKIVKVLEQRRKSIEGSLEKAEELTKQNEAAEVRVNALLSEARKEAEDILGKSHEEAGSIVQAAEDAASQKAEKIIADGKLQIEAEVHKAREALKKETLQLVAQATEAVLAQKVDTKTNEAIIKKALLHSQEGK